MADDLLMPELRAPSAVVRRRGESREQMGMRREGFSDLQTGFGYGRSTSSPLLRAAGLAAQQQRAAVQQDQFDERMDLDERKFQLTREKDIVNRAIQEQALKDGQAAQEHAIGMTAAAEEAARKFGRGNREYYAEVLSKAAQFPLAPKGSPRITNMLKLYEEEFIKSGGNRDEVSARSEVSQARRAIAGLQPEEQLIYLESIPAKYPGAFKAPSASESLMLKSLYDEAKGRAAPVAAAPEGQVPVSTTIKDPLTGASTTYKPPETEKPDKSLLTSLEKDRTLAVNQFAKARKARETAGKVLLAAQKTEDETAINAAKDLVSAADADIQEWDAKRSDAESQLRSQREEKKDAPAAPPTLTSKTEFDALPSGAEYLRDGKRYRKP